MITLETILPASELASFNDLIAQATKQGAGAVMWHSPGGGLVVIGFCSGGELLTWFATPATTEAEAAVARSVILLGVAQASHTLAALQSGAHAAADAVIKKAMH